MIRKAENSDVTAVYASYLDLFAYESEHGSLTNWVPGLYPSELTAKSAFESGTLYILSENNVLCGSMILNHIQPPEYRLINWSYTAGTTEVLVLHTLCVTPSQKGKGYGRQLLEFAVQHAEQTGCKTVRLDTWAENRPAAALYTKMGFHLAGTSPMLLQGRICEQQIFFERKVNHNDTIE